MRAHMGRSIAVAALVASIAGPVAAADYGYSDLDLDKCEVLKRYEEGGGIDLKCAGYGGFDVFVSEGDARMDVDYGVRNDSFETFSAFNNIAEKVEWYVNDDGVQAATIRFLIDVDGRKAQALVVSKVGLPDAPGCVVGVVDAATEQANGIARGLAALTPYFDCATDRIVVLAGANTLAGDFSGARQ